MPVSARQFEEQMQARREQERLNNQLKKYAYDNATLGDACNLVDRTDAQRKRTQRRRQREEREEIERIEGEQRERARKVRLLEQEEALARELSLRKAAEQREKAMRRRICADSEELKDLEKKLKMAYLNKERALQLETKKLNTEAEAEHQRQLDEEMQRYGVAIGPNNDEVQRRNKQRDDSLAKQRVILERQLLEKENRKIAEYKAFLQEKAQVDAVLEKIEAEERAKEEKRLAKIEETKKYIADYLVQRQKWIAEQKAKEKVEQEKLLVWQRQQEERLAAIERQREERRAQEAAKYQQVSANISKEREEQERKEQLMIELAIEEAKLRIVEEERARAARRKELVEQMRLELAAQEELRVQRERERKEQEARLREELLAKYAEDDRLEQLTREAKRRKLEHHKSEVARIIQHRQELAEQRRQAEAAETASKQAAEEERQRLVEQERMRLLRDYASKLQGYLPKGVIKNEADYSLVYQS